VPQEPVVFALLGVLASTFAGAVTCPFDVLRTRLMTQDFQGRKRGVLREFVASPRAWFVGLKYRCLMLGIGGLSWWYFYEKSLAFFRPYICKHSSS
jgi:hypothetical protein